MIDPTLELKVLAFAYVGFAALIVLEMAASLRKRDGTYRLAWSYANLSQGVLYQVFDLFTKALIVAPYLYISQHVSHALFPLNAWWGWVLAFLLGDFFAYGSHRIEHRVEVLWAVHIVHHMSEDMNLVSALRQPLFLAVVGLPFSMVLALIGVPFEMHLAFIIANFLYQFPLHTRYVRSLGPLEWIMNTPAHHRVHHGTNEKYLDKNFGNILIVWDRLFGTFAREEEEPTYGITKPYPVSGPLAVNFVHFRELYRRSTYASSWRDRLAVFFAAPENAAKYERAPRPTSITLPSPRLTAYLSVQMMLTLPLLPWLILKSHEWTRMEGALVALAILVALVFGGALWSNRSWARPAEAIRLILTCALVALVWR